MTDTTAMAIGDRPPLPAGSALRVRIYARLCVAPASVPELADALGVPDGVVWREVQRLARGREVVRVPLSGRRWGVR